MSTTTAHHLYQASRGLRDRSWLEQLPTTVQGADVRYGVGEVAVNMLDSREIDQVEELSNTDRKRVQKFLSPGISDLVEATITGVTCEGIGGWSSVFFKLQSQRLSEQRDYLLRSMNIAVPTPNFEFNIHVGMVALFTEDQTRLETAIAASNPHSLVLAECQLSMLTYKNLPATS